MHLRRALLILALAAAPAMAEEPVRSLAEAAKTVAAGLPAGEIATAERRGEVEEFGGAGNPEPADLPPEQRLFEIGSLTKVFTSLLLAQAVTEGKVTLETTVASLLGPGQHFDDLRVSAITLRQLSTHTSGLPRLPPNLNEGANLADPYAYFDRDHLLVAVAATRMAGEAPFPLSYSNFGAGLLGNLLAQVYGQPWAELVRTKITAPLGMTETTLTLNDAEQARTAPPYLGPKPGHPWDLAALAPAGGLHSTARDLLKFGAAILEPEKSPFPEALALLLQPQTKGGEIGLGIFRRGTGDQLTYHHEGATGGYNTLFQVCPARRTIQIVLVNNGQWAPGKVLAATEAEKPAPQEGALTAEAAKALAGVYRVDDLTRFTVMARGAELWVRLTGQAFYRVFPQQKTDRFFYKNVPAELEFRREKVQAEGLTLFQNAQTVTATRSGAAPEILFPTTKDLEAYAGTYELGPGALFTISVQQETLFAQLTGQGAAPVFCTSPDVFEYDVVKASLEFERDAQGAVIAVKLHQNGRTPRALKTK